MPQDIGHGQGMGHAHGPYIIPMGHASWAPARAQPPKNARAKCLRTHVPNKMFRTMREDNIGVVH